KGDYSEGRNFLEKLAHRTDNAPRLQAIALLATAHLAVYQGDFIESIRISAQCLDVFKGLNDAEGIAWSWLVLGIAELSTGEYLNAREHAEMAKGTLARLDGSENQLALARVFNLLGELSRVSGNYSIARGC